MTETAKVFWSGRSQAVRLPKQFRFVDGEVFISKREDGAVVLEPTSGDRLVSDPAGGAASAIETLRTAIAHGLNSGASSPWDVAEIKRLAREN